MKKFFILSLLALVGISFTSCDDIDYNISFPMWKGFTLSSKTLHAGDTLVVKAVLDKKGKNLYSPTYSWTLNIDTISDEGKVGTKTLSYRKVSNNAHPILINDEPEARFVIPENVMKGTASHHIGFDVEYDNAVDATETISLESMPQEGYEGGRFTYNVASTLYSRTRCTFNTRLTIE